MSDWKVGSRWEHQRLDGSGIADTGGKVLESNPPTRLVTTWEDPTAQNPGGDPSRVTFEIEPYGDIVRLTVTHENLPDEANRELAAAEWAAVVSNLESLLETGHALAAIDVDGERVGVGGSELERTARAATVAAMALV